MLADLLYEDRSLVDYPDKNCHYPVEDWPYFERYSKPPDNMPNVIPKWKR
jgi:hypothetical protein